MVPRLLVVLLFMLLPAVAAAMPQGNVWRVARAVPAADTSLDAAHIQTWIGKTARITQTAISFEGRTCRVTPGISQMQAGVFLAAHQLTPKDLGIPEETLEIVDTGCDIPGFQTLLALKDGRFLMLYENVFFILEKHEPEARQTQEIVIPEAGVRLQLPAAVHTLSPEEAPKNGLGVWFQATPLHELPERRSSVYPYDRTQALLDRAAMASGDMGLTPPDAVPGSVGLENVRGVPVKTWLQLLSGDDPCSLRFRHTLVLYHAHWVLRLALEAAPAPIVGENPGYFSSSKCGDTPHWNLDQGMEKAFWGALRNNGASGTAGLWNQTWNAMLQHIEFSAPSGRPSFLGKNNDACRSLPPGAFASLSPDAALVPQQTFALRFPYGLPGPGGVRTLGLADTCLATLSMEQGDRLAVTAGGGLLEPLPQTDAPQWRTRALGVEDLNDDGLPDIMAVMQSLGPDGPQPDDQVYFSRPAPSEPGGIRWQTSPLYTAKIQKLPTVADVRDTVRSMRAALDLMVGEKLELVGSLEQQFGSLVFVPEMVEQPVRYIIFNDSGNSLAMQEPGQRAWLRARVVTAEDLFGPLTLQLDVLEYKLLNAPPPLD